jgi:hypothetical protein
VVDADVEAEAAGAAEDVEISEEEEAEEDAETLEAKEASEEALEEADKSIKINLNESGQRVLFKYNYENLIKV